MESFALPCASCPMPVEVEAPDTETAHAIIDAWLKEEGKRYQCLICRAMGIPLP